MRYLLITLNFCFYFIFLPAQSSFSHSNYFLMNDNVPCFILPTVVVEAEMKFKSNKDREKWTKLKYNVKKVYPYAIIASAKLKECDQRLKDLPDEKSRKEYLDKFEYELENEFSEQLKKLTFSQGKILIKLIHRETGNTSYDLVKRLRGKFSAFMWQSLAKVFGSNLKSEYDSKGEDQLIEIAIRQVEAGSF